ncbi:MAG: anaerobic ribonucleoside-triphosphate reductase activating protein [Phycisphaerales bacterium]
MEIGGFEPFSLCDFPSRPAAVVFTQGCNFRCPFCHNGSLLAMRPGLIPQREILDRLSRRRGLLPGVVVSGGEPCLQSGLAAFCASVKRLRLAVKLDTNGSRPSVLRELLAEGLIDYVAMDVKAPPRLYARLAGVEVDWSVIEESIGVLAACKIPHHFRTTVVPSLLSEKDLEEIVSLLPASAKHVRQDFRADLARDPALRASTDHMKTPRAEEGVVCVHST